MIAEPPVDGKANDALKELVSRLFGPGVGKNNVRIVRGERGREKVVIVDMSGVEKSAAEEGLVEMAWRRVRGACGGGEGLVEMERRRDRSWWGREG